MRSIRGALLLRLVLGTSLLLLGGAVALYLGVRRLLMEQFDASLETRLHTIASLLEQEGTHVTFEFVGAYLPEYAAEEAPQYFEIWEPGDVDEGEPEHVVLARSRSLGEADLPRSYGTDAEPFTWDLELPDGRPGRAVGAEIPVHKYSSMLFYDPGRKDVIVVVARGRESLDDALALLLGGTVVGIGTLLGGVVLMGRRVVSRGLEPLHDLARHVAGIRDPVHADEVDAAAAPLELRPVAGGLNALLARIRTAFERERRTTANVAHELRTPVSELVILADVARRYADDPAETARALEEVHEIGREMSARIATLLQLARAESGEVPLEVEDLPLGRVVRECWEHHEPAAAAKRQSFRAPAADGPVVRADRAALAIVLSNLLANAVEYAPPESAIACAVENGAGGAALEISNPAGDLTAADLDKLTEPFWRASSAREDRAHAGIGLALASRLAEELDLELSFALEGGAFHARLAFPPAGPAGAS